MEEPTHKTCLRCNTSKPLEAFHRRSSTPSGRVAHCKDCKREIAAARNASRSDADRAAERERVRQRREDASPEQLDAMRRRNREWMARWREANVEEARARALKWQADNRERYLETRAARLDRYKEYNAEYHRRYRELNPQQIAEYKRRRRALKAGGNVSPTDLDALWTGRCALCGDTLDRSLRHPDPLSPSVDHIVPLAKGGAHEQENLQWAHLVCNIRKGAKAP